MKLPNRPPDITIDTPQGPFGKYVEETDDGRHIAYSFRGDPDGAPIFFFHGSPGSSIGPLPRATRCWRDRTFLVSIDRPGYGDSDPLPGRNIADGVRDVERIADRLEIGRFAVAGRSGGGQYTIGCVALLGERISSAACLAGLAPGVQEYDHTNGEVVTPDNAEKFKAALIDPVSLKENLEDHARALAYNRSALLAFLEADLHSGDKKALQFTSFRSLTEHAQADGMKHGAQGWLDDILAAKKHEPGYSIRGNPHFAHVPVFLWTGDKDNFSLPSNSEQMKYMIPRARLIVGKGAHFTAGTILPDMLCLQRKLYFRQLEAFQSNSPLPSADDFIQEQDNLKLEGRLIDIPQTINHYPSWYESPNQAEPVIKLWP